MYLGIEYGHISDADFLGRNFLTPFGGLLAFNNIAPPPLLKLGLAMPNAHEPSPLDILRSFRTITTRCSDTYQLPSKQNVSWVYSLQKPCN